MPLMLTIISYLNVIINVTIPKTLPVSFGDKQNCDSLIKLDRDSLA